MLDERRSTFGWEQRQFSLATTVDITCFVDIRRCKGYYCYQSYFLNDFTLCAYRNWSCSKRARFLVSFSGDAVFL